MTTASAAPHEPLLNDGEIAYLRAMIERSLRRWQDSHDYAASHDNIAKRDNAIGAIAALRALLAKLEELAR